MKTMTFAATMLIAGTFVLSCMAVGASAAEPKKPEAKAQIEAALTVSNRENRRVLIQWGANWCGLCVLLDERFRTDPGLSKSLLYEYVVVHVDVDKGDKNVDLSRQYKMPFSIPSLTVLDAAGKVLANQAAWRAAGERQPQEPPPAPSEPARASPTYSSCDFVTPEPRRNKSFGARLRVIAEATSNRNRPPDASSLAKVAHASSGSSASCGQSVTSRQELSGAGSTDVTRSPANDESSPST